ncbi:hypothetical protein [Cupriavidus sp. TMH.W2]|uniref:hypothetical protein n=1 Tax=Cupriavidus sp. TMH.W2 TaxID=3434465 RepID=UPI003D78158C
MRKMILAAVAVGAGIMANPAVADMPEQLLSVRRLTVGDSVELALPTIQKSDGSVCMAYAASVSRDSGGKLTIGVGEVCGKQGVAKKDADGLAEVWPDNLRVLNSVVSHGLRVEVPQLADGSVK